MRRQWFRNIKDTIKDRIKLLKMPLQDFKMMRLKSQKYDDILSTIYISQSVSDYIDCKDKHGNIVYRYPKQKQFDISVDIDKILHIVGIDVVK